MYYTKYAQASSSSYGDDIEARGTKTKENTLSDYWFIKWYNSPAPVSRLYINAGICVGAFLTFLPVILPPTDELTLDQFPMLSYEPYKLSIAVNVALAVPLLIDTILDNMNKFQMAAERLRVAIAVIVFVPTLVVLLVCFDNGAESPPFRLFASLVICQQAFLYGLIFQILNVHDSVIWTDVRTAILITGHVMGWAFYAMRLSISPIFGALGALCHLLNMLHFMFIILVLWGPKYASLFRAALSAHSEEVKDTSFVLWLSKFVFALEGSVYSFMTADEAVSIFYLMLSVAMITITLLPVTITKGFLLGSYAQSAFIILLTVYPGRVARQKAKESDTALKSKKAFVQYVSHEARGPLSVASMGLELHLIDLRGAMAPGLGSSLEESATRNEWLSQRCVHVNEIVDSCMVAQNTLNDLLTYDKIESGMLQMEKEYLLVMPFIHKELSPYAIQSRYKNISVHYNWKNGQVHNCYENIQIQVDKHKIAQVFRNLLSNALKFTPENGNIHVNVRILCWLQGAESHPGGLATSPLLTDSWLPGISPAVTRLKAPSDAPSISMSTTRSSMRQKNEGAALYKPDDIPEDAYVDITEVDFSSLDRQVLDVICRVEVVDNGPGVRKEQMPKLFGKYVQFNAAQMQQGGGSGLGLWLSKNIVELHGGHIGCTSSGVEGQGSTFYFELPVDQMQLEMPFESTTSIAVINMNTTFAQATSSYDSQNGPRNAVWTSPSALARAADEAASEKHSARSARIAPVVSSPPVPTSTSPPVSRRSGGEDSLDSDAVRKVGLWNEREKLQSGMNALLSSNIELTPGASAPADLVVNQTGATASVGTRSRNASFARKLGDKPIRLNIMVVDDTPLSRKMMKRALKTIAGELTRSVKLQVHEGGDGADAVVMVENAAPSRAIAAAAAAIGGDEESRSTVVYYDMLFIDSEMAVVSGAEAITAIRGRLNYTGPVYAVTGHGTGQELDRLTAAGATSVFTKPVGVQQLTRLIEEYVDVLVNKAPGPGSLSNPTVLCRSGSGRSTQYITQQLPNSSESEDMQVASFNIDSRSADPSLHFRTLHVMVVDDTPMHRKMIIRALKAIEGTKRSNLIIHIHEGTDGSDAIEMVAQSNSPTAKHKYDVIFIDYDMVNINGAVAIKSVREKHGYLGRIFAVTANESEAEHMKLKEAGATSIFIKPLRIEQLKLLIDDL